MTPCLHILCEGLPISRNAGSSVLYCDQLIPIPTGINLHSLSLSVGADPRLPTLLLTMMIISIAAASPMDNPFNSIPISNLPPSLCSFHRQRSTTSTAPRKEQQLTRRRGRRRRRRLKVIRFRSRAGGESDHQLIP